MYIYMVRIYIYINKCKLIYLLNKILSLIEFFKIA